MSDSCLLPEFDATEVAEIARRLFALEGAMKQLHGERDLNFLIDDARGRFVFKIANAQESPAMLECQHQVFQRLAEAQVFPMVATALESVKGNLIETARDTQDNEHYCRALPFIDGHLWADFDESKPELLGDLGRRLALLDQALAGFSHPGLERPLLWNMESAMAVLEDYKPLLTGTAERSLVEHFEDGFRERVLPVQNELRRAVIHNDANRQNVIVDDSGQQVLSIIDFGDMLDLWLVVEPAIAAAYAMLDEPDPLRAAQALVGGYHRALPLTATEIGLLFDLICMRLCMSVCICAHQRRLEPDNDYLSIDQQQSWDLLERLQGITCSEAHEAFHETCHSE
ncbi:MAG: phosphotransferase [Gammaproteobacteria bacterium]|nr:phosphotransferase [Gammaproteobacteria bacterium]